MRTILALGCVLCGLAGCTDDAEVLHQSPGGTGGASGQAGSSGTGGTEDAGGTGGTGGTGATGGTGGSGGTTASACGDASRYASVAAAVEAQVTAQSAKGVAVAVIEGGEVCWTAGFGDKGSGPLFDPVEPTTLFETESAHLTAVAILQQAELGNIDLDEPIKSYLPDLQVQGSSSWAERATVRDLLMFTSGLTDEWPASAAALYGSDDSGIEQYFLGDSFKNGVYEEFPPGAALQWSNVGYALLTWLLELRSGQSYSDYVRQHILQPLGSSRAFFLTSEVEGDGDYAYGGSDHALKRGSHGLFTSVVEVAKVAQFLLHGNQQVLSNAGFDSLLEKASDNSALFGKPVWYGPGVVTHTDGLLLLQATGYTPTGIEHVALYSSWAHGSQIHLVPSRDFGLILLSRPGILNAMDILRTAYKDLLGIDTPEPALSPCDASEFNQFVGDYVAPTLSDTMNVVLESGHLVLRRGETTTQCTLTPAWPRAFNCNGSLKLHDDDSAWFEHDANGSGDYLVTGGWVATRVPDADAGAGDASPE